MTNHSFRIFSNSPHALLNGEMADPSYLRRLIHDHFEVIEFDEEMSRLVVKSEGAGHKDTLIVGSIFSGGFCFVFLLMVFIGTMNAYAAASVGVLCAVLCGILYLKAKACRHFHVEFIVGSGEATISLNNDRQTVILDEKTLTLASYQADTGPLRHGLHLNTTFKNRNYLTVTKGTLSAKIPELMMLQTMLLWRHNV